MEIYGSFTSPFVRHIRIVLNQSGLSHTFVETGMESSAELSPTKKVPFLKDGDILLSDSQSILRYIREKLGETFLPSVEDLDQFCLIDTLLDSSANLFFLELNGLKPAEHPYLQRQQQRVVDGLKYLDGQPLSRVGSNVDVMLRLECFLYWGLFRKRFSIEGLANLQKILREANEDPMFESTAPPQ